jgi:hypothetical protein
VYLHRPLPVGVRAGDGDLNLDGTAGRKRERRVQGQLRDLPAAGSVPRRHRQLDEGRGRQQHGTAYRVVGQPRLRPQRQLASQHEALAGGELDRRAEQRVPGRVQARDGRGTRDGSALGRPVPLVLEGVGGQFGPRPGGQHRCPVDGNPGDVGLGKGGEQPGGTAVVAAQGSRDDRGQCRLLGGGRDRGGQHGMRRGLDEYPVPGGGQHPDRAVELYRCPQARVPVPGV